MTNFNYNDGKKDDKLPPAFADEKELEERIEKYCIDLTKIRKGDYDNKRKSSATSIRRK